MFLPGLPAHFCWLIYLQKFKRLFINKQIKIILSISGLALTERMKNGELISTDRTASVRGGLLSWLQKNDY